MHFHTRRWKCTRSGSVPVFESMCAPSLDGDVQISVACLYCSVLSMHFRPASTNAGDVAVACALLFSRI